MASQGYHFAITKDDCKIRGDGAVRKLHQSGPSVFPIVSPAKLFNLLPYNNSVTVDVYWDVDRHPFNGPIWTGLKCHFVSGEARLWAKSLSFFPISARASEGTLTAFLRGLLSSPVPSRRMYPAVAEYWLIRRFLSSVKSFVMIAGRSFQDWHYAERKVSARNYGPSVLEPA